MSDEIRPEVVDAVVKAWMNFDVSAVAELASITPAEKAAADALILEGLQMRHTRGDGLLAVYAVFADAGLQVAGMSWSEVFDRLDASHIERLRDLYIDIPAEGRAEFDRRYGRPEL